MILRTTVFMGMLFTTHASHSMEMVKKIIKNNHNTDDSINKELHFAYRISKNNILPIDITKHITLYCVALKDEEFKEFSPVFQETWFKIDNPTLDYYFLTSKQKKLMRSLLTSRSMSNEGPAGTIVNYYLKSPKDYTLFLTLPLEYRQQLTLLPSRINNLPSPYINQHKTIQVKTIPTKVIPYRQPPLHNSRCYGSNPPIYETIPKPIVPEEINKK